MKTICHRDHTVTVWNPHTQQWHRTAKPSDELLASLDWKTRVRVRRHTERLSMRAITHAYAEAIKSGDTVMMRRIERAAAGSMRDWRRCKDIILAIA